MAEIAELEKIGLVSKICAEMDACVGFSDKDVAEFIIHLSGSHETHATFHDALAANGAEFPMANTLEIFEAIRRARAPATTSGSSSGAGGGVSAGPLTEEQVKFPGLTGTNTQPVPLQDMASEVVESVAKSELERNSKNRNMAKEILAKNRAADAAGSKGGSGNAGVDDGRPSKKSRFSDSATDGAPASSSSSSSSHNGPRNIPSGPMELVLYGIYTGTVGNIKDFGCFVELQGVTGENARKEGMVHVGQIGNNVRDVKTAVSKGQKVKVKVISIASSKIALSMKEVDQQTGEDLLPERAMGAQVPVSSSVPQRQRETNVSRGQNDDKQYGRSAHRLSEQELWEAQQLAQAGVIPASQNPMYDHEGGRGVLGNVETERDLDIELNETEPAFLRGQTRGAREMDSVKIVKNPDGSMERAGRAQTALTKERRELKQAEQNNLTDAIPKDLSKPWEDPMPQAGERHFAAELRSVNLTDTLEIPEWKQKVQGKGLSFGIINTNTLQEQRKNLPIARLRNELCTAISENQVLVVIGETGSGKTTQMTQYMSDMGYTKHGMIGCTQPRRVAAMSVAKRVAEEFGCELGEDVGYTIRFEDCTSPSTKIKYMTDGMLMREYLADTKLSRYVAIMLDEAHERTIHTDVLFGLLKQLLQERPDFKLIVTSATLDAEKFSKYFLNCPIFTIPGRTFPVEVLYCKEPEADYMEAALITIMQIHLSEPAGDILVFLTGQEEIDTCSEILFTRMKALGELAPELIILPVYSALPSEMQSRIFEPAPEGSRKVVIATNIAEASLTIDGIYYVVDPGFSKQKVFNAKLAMDSLVVCPISMASARQRTGRAGRTGPGKCFRLYTEAAYATEMMGSSVPEIQRTNLGNVVLQMKAMGINDLLGFDFMDPPPIQTLVGAMMSLFNLGALDDEGLLTRLGRKMAEFPLEPSLSKMLILSADLGCAEEVLTIVAMLSVENPYFRPKDKAGEADMKKAKFNSPDGDHISLLLVWQGWEASKFSNPWCYENYIQARSMRRAQDVRKQLVTIMDRYKMPVESAGRNLATVRKCIVAGFFFHAAKKDPQEGYKTLVEQQCVYIHPSSALFQKSPEWVVYHELVLTTKEYMRNILVIDPRWLVELAPNFFQQADPTKMSRAKRNEKIQPLFDRFNPPDAWRLSRRKG
jgi:ATP-dependent RNA helicase DHX8/PRP22